ncbi:SAM-dependent chlorinase/fluorinase [Oscillatoria sp. FACHB-1406]|uniref:SAM hydrolase/SAM-dependent halogenase family protein n=1 Tax=Oscillatoria sp. FACHB-1406 TaxID=2692846 RepID=UPI0016893631|nr:SAM-dependent chlorinase/fluorinase [Oscillatoria sp. FACHB-1406]MBD2577385.1 SAM-dependent chlorinase/fluorinase [Oscillatoria sp. FACHB-1406]
MNQPKIITLLSDFGWQDSYVGAMKGAIARINPTLNILDLTHDIPPQDLTAARFCLLNTYRYFPDGTVHVAVVDPGVGSRRRAIAVQIAAGTLVGPDNGIFSGILSETPAFAAVELTNPDYWRIPSPSNTFHGRDIFAPVGAHLASGTPLAELGDAIAPGTLVQLPFPALKPTATGLEGCIQYCDRFGNLIANIPAAAVAGKSWFLSAGERTFVGVKTYNDVAKGESLALVGSHGWVEIAVNGGSARSQLNLDCGAVVCLRVTG